MKKLYKQREGSKFCGVCIGLAEFLEVDVTIIRIATLLFGVFGVGLVVYLCAALIMPYKD